MKAVITSGESNLQATFSDPFLTDEFLNDAIIYLKGGWYESGGTYYMKDSKNGYDFEIVDFDWEIVDGFPYKSKATIKAPASGAGKNAIELVDFNDFFYTSGVPNEIPVVSLFEDVDFENQLFCRHVDSVVNSYGAETSEPKVCHIVLFDAPVTGTKLTQAQTLYDVPDEESYEWVSKDGNDGTGDGSKGNPWLTIAHALTQGNDVYVTSGEYDQGASFITFSNKNVYGLGYVRLKSSDTYAAYATGTASISRIIFDKTGGYSVLTGSGTVTIDKVVSDGSRLVLSTANGNLIVTDSVIYYTGSEGVYGRATLTCNGNIFTGAGTRCIRNGTAGNLIANNNRVAGVNTQFAYSEHSCTMDVIGNDLGTSQIGAAVEINDANTTIDFSYNTGIVTGYIFQVESNGPVPNFTYNNITSSGAGQLIEVRERGLICKYNLLANTANGSIVECSANLNSVTCEISYNGVINVATPGGMIKVGTEGYANKDNVIVTVEGNYILGPTTANSAHGIFIYNNQDVTCRYNYIVNCGLALVMKGTGVGGADYTNCKVMYNICVSGYAVFKGVSNCKFYGNVIDQQNLSISNLDNLGDVAVNNVIKNNIFINRGGPDGIVYHVYALSSVIADYNCVYTPNGAYAMAEQDIPATKIDWAAWQATGQDTNSITVDPELTGYRPLPDSPVRGVGINLGAVYEEALHQVKWGGITSLPEIITKSQIGWDIGGYVI